MVSFLSSFHNPFVEIGNNSVSNTAIMNEVCNEEREGRILQHKSDCNYWKLFFEKGWFYTLSSTISNQLTIKVDNIK